MREEYITAGLLEDSLHPDPLLQFEAWFQQARAAGIEEPNAMTLATASAAGVPSARVVLLKDITQGGFVFFTNYESRKAAELTSNPHAALVFYWHPLHRQVRIEGRVSRTSEEESVRYFETRPRGSQLGAWASRQSAVIERRDVLDNEMAALEARHGQDKIPVPPFWGGFRLVPLSIEFWQGRLNRLHDRLRYVARDGGAWSIERLSP